MTDRDQSYDVDVTSPKPSTKSTLFPADQYDACPAPIMALTNNWASLNALVDTMTPNGSTNQTIGLAWAWETLTQGQPMNAPGVPNNTMQAIVLLSDGLNTQNRWNGNGSDVSPEVDARMNLVCSNAKAAGIIIYTVHVNTGGDPTSTVLQNCASKSANFFALTTAGAIVTAFNQIGTQLAQLRISN